MERAHIPLIAAAVAALALSALIVYSERTTVSDEPQARDTRKTEAPAGVGDQRMANSGRSAAGHAPSQQLPAGERAGPDEGQSHDSVKPGAAPAARSAQTLAVGDAPRGMVSVARPAVNPAVESSIAVASTAPGVRPLHPQAGMGSESAGVHPAPATLEGQPPAAQNPAADNQPAAEGEEGVVLSVPLKDTTQAEDFSQPMAQQDVRSDDQGTTFTKDSFLMFPDAGNARSDAGTISFDIAPQWNGGDAQDNYLAMIAVRDQGTNTIKLFKNGVYLRFILTDSVGQETDISVPIDSWAKGDQHRVAATWGEAATALYIDGELAGQNTYSGELQIPSGTPLYLGSSHLPGGGAGATLQNFKVYGRVLTAEDVATH